MKTSVTVLLGCVLSVMTALGQGTVLWDESANGPLSNDYTHPTSLGALQQGTNSLSGATEFEPTGGTGAIYGDYFTFVIPGTSSLAGLWLQVDRPVAIWFGQENFSSRISDAVDPISGDFFYQLGLVAISSGTYDMYVKSDDVGPSPSVSNYRFDFVLETVPEPNTFALVALGIGLVGSRHWKRGKRSHGHCKHRPTTVHLDCQLSFRFLSSNRSRTEHGYTCLSRNRSAQLLSPESCQPIAKR
jgi:hypothetical protein